MSHLTVSKHLKSKIERRVTSDKRRISLPRCPFLSFILFSVSTRSISFRLLPSIPFFYIPPSTRPQCPIIFCPFSISLIAFDTHQTLITIEKQNTYVPISPFTNVKNIRQIRLFMQNKAKVKIGNHEFFLCLQFFRNPAKIRFLKFESKSFLELDND